jgi:hypothetical protein
MLKEFREKLKLTNFFSNGKLYIKRKKKFGLQQIQRIGSTRSTKNPKKKKKIQDYTTQKTTWSPNEVTKKQAHNPPNPPRFRFTTT